MTLANNIDCICLLDLLLNWLDLVTTEFLFSLLVPIVFSLSRKNYNDEVKI